MTQRIAAYPSKVRFLTSRARQDLIKALAVLEDGDADKTRFIARRACRNLTQLNRLIVKKNREAYRPLE